MNFWAGLDIMACKTLPTIGNIMVISDIKDQRKWMLHMYFAKVTGPHNFWSEF